MGKILVIKGANFSVNSIGNTGSVGEEKTFEVDFSKLTATLGGFTSSSATWSIEDGFPSRAHFYIPFEKKYQSLDIIANSTGEARFIFVDSSYDESVTKEQNAPIVGAIDGVRAVIPGTQMLDVAIPDNAAGVIVLLRNGSGGDRIPDRFTLKMIS